MKAKTKREKAFIDAYLSGCTLDQCALQYGSTGTSKASLAQIGYQILKRLQVEDEELAAQLGLTKAYWFGRIKEGIEAKKPLIATWEGKITDQLDIEDRPTQHKYLETLAKQQGWLSDRIELTGKDGGEIHLELSQGSDRKKKKSIEL